jgi:hypothetical protein
MPCTKAAFVTTGRNKLNEYTTASSGKFDEHENWEPDRHKYNIPNYANSILKPLSAAHRPW